MYACFGKWILSLEEEVLRIGFIEVVYFSRNPY